MTSRDFCYWLQGYFEVSQSGGGTTMSGDQLECIRKHLELVFLHEIDPSFGPPKKQVELNKVHGIGGHVPGGPDVLIRC